IQANTFRREFDGAAAERRGQRVYLPDERERFQAKRRLVSSHRALDGLGEGEESRLPLVGRRAVGVEFRYDVAAVQGATDKGVLDGADRTARRETEEDVGIDDRATADEIAVFKAKCELAAGVEALVVIVRRIGFDDRITA